jgi:hypothetical protein
MANLQLVTEIKLVMDTVINNKIDEEFRFKYYKKFDITEIKKEINKLNSEWYLDTSRQDQHGVHKDTITFFLTDYDVEWMPYSKYNITIKDLNSTLWNLVQPIIYELEQIHNGKVGKVLFPRLKAKNKIYKHWDSTEYLNVVRRHHIPIITNKNVYFYVDDGALNMFEGECWEINNMKSHEVINNSDEDRIHLMIDIIPNKYINDN